MVGDKDLVGEAERVVEGLLEEDSEKLSDTLDDDVMDSVSLLLSVSVEDWLSDSVPESDSVAEAENDVDADCEVLPDCEKD